VLDRTEQQMTTTEATLDQPVTDRPVIDQAHWQERLDTLARAHGVPGATLAVLRLGPDGGADELMEAATGVLSTTTGVEVTPDSVFQIGSITKVWTATMVMQLVDEGKLTLDAPVADVLPDLQLADPDVAAKVTMRHLLTHTSGIDGDVFTDTGRGDDVLERYAAALVDVPQNHPLGATFSYCNSGYSLAGRVVEVLTGQTWDAALRERVITPLGLTHTSTLPEEAIVHRVAVGHISPGEGEDPQPAATWLLPRSVGPAGLINAAVPRTPHSCRRTRPPRCRRCRPSCRTPTASATPGGWAGSASTGTARGSTATTGRRSGRTPSSGCCPTRGSRWCC
jgi:CubicO group peptidase (beta-lactamase class C family)